MADPVEGWRTIRIRSWLDLRQRLSGFDRSWIFRGERRASWTLSTSLQRTETTNPVVDERDLLLLFQRGAPVHLSSHMVPDAGDVFGWLGLMQHYGAPTRLSDWTRSPYVASFFALEKTNVETRPDKAQPHAIWALDLEWTQRRAIELLPAILRELPTILPELTSQQAVTSRQADLVTRLVLTDLRFTGAVVVEPWRLDARQAAQQSLFVCPGNVEHSLDDNLRSMITGHESRPVVVKFELEDNERPIALADLASMNVTAANLFPGLDGFARSLRTKLAREHPALGGLRAAIMRDPWEPERQITLEVNKPAEPSDRPPDGSRPLS
jgi:hypothetical protein